MSGGRIVLPAALLIALVGLVGYFLIEPNDTPAPLNPNGTAAATTATSPSGVTAPPAIATATATANGSEEGKGNGNPAGNGAGNGAEAGDTGDTGDVVPVPNPGGVKFTFTLPEGTAASSRLRLEFVAPGPEPSSRPLWVRSTSARQIEGQRYEATLGMLAPGEHTFFVDAPGVGTWGRQRVTITAHEVAEVALSGFAGICDVTVSAKVRGEGAAVPFDARLIGRTVAGSGGGREITGGAGAEGSLSVRCLPGDYVLRVSAAGFAPHYRAVTITSSSRALSVELERAARLSIALTNQSGEPARERYVRLVGDDDIRHELGVGVSDGDKRFLALGGKFDMRVAPVGRWEIEVAIRPRTPGSWKRLGSVLLEAGKHTEERYTVND